MAIGAVKGGLSSIAAGARLTIQPSGSEVWTIHNIFTEDSATLEWTDGTNVLAFDSQTGKGAWTGMFFHVTNSLYIRVKNDAASAKLIGYSGVQIA